MSTWKWIWRISLPNQSMVQHFELSEICFFTIVLMYATKGGSKFWSLVSKYISSWSIHSRGVTVNRWILHHQSSRDIPYHGGASNPNCSWRRLRYQSNQEWSPYGGDFNFILFLFSYISYVVLKVCPVFDHWWHSRDVSIELSFTDQLRDTICVDSYSLHLLHVSISRVVFCRSTPGYQIVKLYARYLSGMDGLQCLPKYTHEVRGGERE